MERGAVIRDLMADDRDRVLEINQANVPDVGHLDLAALSALVDQCAIPLVSVVDGDIAGFCLVLAPGAPYESVNYRWFMERFPNSMYLDRVAFDSKFVGRGLGSQLYAEVDRRMRHDHSDADALTLEVNVDPPNDVSLAFHAKHGFAEVGRQMSHGIEVSLMSRQR